MKAHPLEKHLAECLAEWKMYIKMLKAFLPHKGPNNHRVELGGPPYVHTHSGVKRFPPDPSRPAGLTAVDAASTTPPLGRCSAGARIMGKSRPMRRRWSIPTPRCSGEDVTEKARIQGVSFLKNNWVTPITCNNQYTIITIFAQGLY